jgi:ectoine hydroxylase-related dioxygenase (phytanoyl-CoA dioxygenase family)
MTGSPRRLRALAADLAPDRALTLEESTAGLARVEPWVHALLHPGPDPEARQRQLLIEGCSSAGAPLRVVELAGEPGDVVLMDLRCLHAPSANTSDQPRLVVKMACINLRC